MLTKNDFSPEDWNSLRDLPHLVGFATLFAGSSGLGTVKESLAIAQGILEGQSSNVPLIRDLANRAEIESAQAAIRETLGDANTKIPQDRMKSLVLERVGTGLSVLGVKGTLEEVAAFRQWLYGIAEKVAKAAKEGGFLGFGGTQVSEEELAFLSDLRTALQLPVSGS